MVKSPSFSQHFYVAKALPLGGPLALRSPKPPLMKAMNQGIIRTQPGTEQIGDFISNTQNVPFCETLGLLFLVETGQLADDASLVKRLWGITIHNQAEHGEDWLASICILPFQIESV
jgi:hypothetical protein